VADLVAFLAPDRAASITGSEYVIDGARYRRADVSFARGGFGWSPQIDTKYLAA